MDFIAILAREFKLREAQVRAVIELLDAGNTIPFIARYRKEATGSLDDQLLRELAERLEYLRHLEKRRQEILDAFLKLFCTRRFNEIHIKMISEETLPLTIGGGIGQSRLCMLLLEKAHIGEVQVSVWPEDMLATCREKGVKML